ncbi:MAG TPA: 16S rRNA (adenine(1518)-N(6)/adenine(1519)-N(6))-dimethyltransferase RsmA [Candidatus Limnocylindrales bacterium]|nr:16S rRNA (adenine(1518)-N(6)/adenine(1519)-N(6))-dimethyltransferase RsmA [Candidatus Limnocylindrales bacterium]
MAGEGRGACGQRPIGQAVAQARGAGILTREKDDLDPQRLSAEGIERYLRRHGLTANRRRSQNHLVDGQVLEDIIDLAAPVEGGRVLEIGPGLGILTSALLTRGAKVTAVEVDPRLVGHLRTRLDAAIGAGQLELVEGDALDIAVTDLVHEPYDLVANIPYHITSPLMHHVLGGEPRPKRFVLMVQREVAERIAAKPGDMSYLSVFVQYHADVRVGRIVPASAFEPAPEVQSAVLVGETRPRRLDEEGEEQLWRVVQAGFRERRKMLHNVLPRQLPQVGRERFTDALAKVGIAPDRRPQTVSVEEWMALAATIGPID